MAKSCSSGVLSIFIKEDYVLLFNAIKNLLTAYHINKPSTGKIIESF